MQLSKMKLPHMSKYTISCCLFLLAFFAQAQENKPLEQNDSLVYKKNYGLRVGVDLSKPIIAARDVDYKGFEIVADYRLRPNLYIAAELGHVEKTSEEDRYQFFTKGSYLTVGINRNAFKNWLEMDNELYYGFRYGFSRFSQTLNQYTVFQKGVAIDGTSSAYFDPATEQPNRKFEDQNAHWVSLVLGMKVETFKNLYLGLAVNISKLLSIDTPDNFENLYVPGFNKVYATNSSVSFNYTLSYRIPLYKK